MFASNHLNLIKTLVPPGWLLFLDVAGHGGGQAALRERGVPVVLHHGAVAFWGSILTAEVHAVGEVHQET